MSMFVPPTRADAERIVADPSARPETLDAIARAYPDLHSAIARHPHAPAAFLAWVSRSGEGALGESRVTQAVLLRLVRAARRVARSGLAGRLGGA